MRPRSTSYLQALGREEKFFHDLPMTVAQREDFLFHLMDSLDFICATARVLIRLGNPL